MRHAPIFLLILLLVIFRGKSTKVKTNIIFQYYFEVTISIYQQYDIFKLFETKYEKIYI